MHRTTSLIAVLLLVGCGSMQPSGTGGGSAGGLSAGGGSAAGGSAAGGSAAGGSAAGGSAAGGSAAGGSAAGGSAAGGSAAGGSAAGGSAAGGTAMPVAIVFSTTCASLTPCVSSPVGQWRYTSACVDSTNPYPTLSAACSGLTFSNLAGTTTGQVNITANTVTRNISTNITGNIAVPTACVVPLGGCSGVQTLLRQTMTTATCTGTTTCDCTFSDMGRIATTSPSSIAGSTLTTDPGTAGARTWGFCNAGGMLTYKETTAQPRDTGIYTMSP
ncbi:MAG: hypothetical protein JNJ54_36315 [Myxococcaceae bacterium]|nr:hypothetical protein [Myxococcaceae bacterium]